MKESRISEKTFTSLLIGIAPIIALYYALTGRPINAAFWASLAIFQIILFLKREMSDDW